MLPPNILTTRTESTLNRRVFLGRTAREASIASRAKNDSNPYYKIRNKMNTLNNRENNIIPYLLAS